MEITRINFLLLLLPPPDLVHDFKVSRALSFIHSTHFNPEDGGSIHLRNAVSTAHIHRIQRPNNRINLNNEAQAYPKISDHWNC
jgi:hypothetical protein